MVTLGFNIDEQSSNFEEKRNDLLKAYKKVFLDSKPFEGVDEVISLFEERKILWGIVTNKPKIFSAQIFKSLGWDKKAKYWFVPMTSKI